MDARSGNPYQRTSSLYWSVSVVSLRRIIDQVRTTLTELVAELRAGTPRGGQLPSPEVTAQAVNVAIHGRRARVHVSSPQIQGSYNEVIADVGIDGRWWTTWRKVGAFLSVRPPSRRVDPDVSVRGCAERG